MTEITWLSPSLLLPSWFRLLVAFQKRGALTTELVGKGFGHFDAQGTFGVGLPLADTNLIGRTYAWNNAFQCRLFRKSWPEVEMNSTFFQDGTSDGEKQNFATPGLVIGRLHLWKRVSLTIGGGYQIATTHFHTTNHNYILSIRIPF